MLVDRVYSLGSVFSRRLLGSGAKRFLAAVRLCAHISSSISMPKWPRCLRSPAGTQELPVHTLHAARIPSDLELYSGKGRINFGLFLLNPYAC